jgi:LysM repeat protein
MQAYVDDFKRAFRNEMVPEKYLYLAIPESHFNFEAKSWAGAIGPYQFTLQTAEEVGLAKTSRGVNGRPKVIYDYRKDPVKSAEACAKYLRKKYDQCGDWRLAVAAYNGIVGRYFLSENDKEKRDYNGFVEFVEDDLNKKKEIVEKKYYSYEVQNGDTLSEISDYFGVDLSVLRESNDFLQHGNNIKAGQMIKVKIATPEQKIALFEKLANLRGLGENFNYPAKFEAVWMLIKEAELKARYGKNILIRESVARQAGIDREGERYYVYSVKSGDTISNVALKEIRKKNLKVSADDMVDEIKKINNLKSGNIRVKQKLKIPLRV